MTQPTRTEAAFVSKSVFSTSREVPAGACVTRPGTGVGCPLRGLAGKAGPLALGCTGLATGQRGPLPPGPESGWICSQHVLVLPQLVPMLSYC